MVDKSNNDSFLHSLDKMLNASKEKGSVTITLKRLVKPDNDRYRPGTKQKRELIEKERQRSVEDPSKKFSLILHAKTDGAKTSTEVEPVKTSSFQNSLINVCRLYCFKTISNATKKIKKPTPRNPNSKTSKKLEARKQLKKLKNMKKKEKLIQKHLAKKTAAPTKMEVEKAK